MAERDLITELERLMKLHQAGVITSEELQILKKKAIENDTQTNSTVEIEKKDTIEPLDTLTSTSDEKVKEFLNADTEIPKIFNEKIEEIEKTSDDEKIKPQEETEIYLSHKLSLKRDSLFWAISTLFAWIFPPLTIFLLSTKKGENTIGFKVKGKLQLYRAKQNSSVKDLKSIFKLKKSPEEKLKEKARNRNFFTSVKLRIKQLKIFWIWSIIALIILFIANYRQGEFNRPYMERLLTKSKLHLTFLMDEHLEAKENYMNLDFEIEDKKLVNYYDGGGKIAERHNYAAMWFTLNTAYNIVPDGDGILYFNNLKKINFSKFSLTFRSPNYTAKHFTREIFYDIHYELEVKLKGSDTQRMFLCFWSFIPDLYIPNLPKMNDDGSIDVEIEERMYKKITDVQDGNLGSKQIRNGDEFSSFNGKVFITPNNIFENTSNIEVKQDTAISKSEVPNDDAQLSNSTSTEIYKDSDPINSPINEQAEMEKNLNDVFGDNSSVPSGKTNKIVQEENDAAFISVDEMPAFPGGEEGLMKYINSSLTFPQYEKENGISGIVYVYFVINKEGNVEDAKIARGVKGGEGLDNEALRVIKAMPKWSIARQNGKPAKVQITYPVKFVLK